MKLDSSQGYLVSLDFSKFERFLLEGFAFDVIFIQVNETNNWGTDMKD